MQLLRFNAFHFNTFRFKALAIIVSICALGLISISVSIWFAKVTESDAAAINVSGSLRMQSWRLSEKVLIPELTDEKSLERFIDGYDDSIRSLSLSKLADRRNSLGHLYYSLLDEWSHHMRPLLLDNSTHQQFTQKVPGFVDRIDDLVNALQKNTENKLQWLFILAVITLCGILFIGIFAIRFVRADLIGPVEALSTAAQKVSAGDFKQLNLTYTKSNELGQLTRIFDSMAHELGVLYNTLEDQVSQKTRSLEVSNTALQLLYHASQTLGVNPYDEKQLQSQLKQWKRLLNLPDFHICLTSEAGSQKLQRIYPGSEVYNPVCLKGQCEGCISKPVSDWQFPLMIKDQAFGYLHITTHNRKHLPEESRQWIRTFSDIVATSLYRSSYQIQEHRLLLMEERAVIARELHDSLAQALSYQKIQVVRLRRQLIKNGCDGSVSTIVDDLREGVNSAYRQLRELLITFRLNISEGSLEEALNNTLAEYIKRAGHIDFQLDYQLRYCSLDAHHQIHVLQIVREALVNIIQHTQAGSAHVQCLALPDSRIQVCIDDDGEGFQQRQKQDSGHYGTTIMQERAVSLGGDLSFTCSPSGGARVLLEFPINNMASRSVS